ncbi:MAG TPA: hypothetical protein VFB34_00125, partial [Chloroflexota bacterium]|nr:hypothetical protein [Chloroflexota bacterium]
MVHLPAANGYSPRSAHRSKWYGATRHGRKFLECVLPWTAAGQLLSRAHQHRLIFDGITARRLYRLDGD